MFRAMLIAAGLVMLTAPAEHAQAQFYRGKTITIIVNYPAGGPTDIEARIVAQHLPAHIPGNPTVVIRNVGGAGGLIGSNQLGESTPNGETIGFFTQTMTDQILGNSAMRTRYSDFIPLAGIESPLVVYMRKDTPPGINVAADIMKTNGFKALSLNAQNTNTMNQTIGLDLLGVKFQPIPSYRGLKDVETAILQNIGQLANSSLSGWRGSVEPTMGNVVIPLWQLAPRSADGAYRRSKALPDLPTFEEFYASVHPGKKLEGTLAYEALRAFSNPQLAMFRIALAPPGTPPETIATLRAAFIELWKNKAFLMDYSKLIHTEPIMISGEHCQDILADLGKVRPEVKEFLISHTSQLLSR